MAGAGALFLFVWNITEVSDRVSSDVPPIGYFIGVVAAWWYFSDLVVVGFGRRWGRWPQISALAVALALVLVDLVAYGGIWDSPLAWGIFLFTEFFYGFFAVSFFLVESSGVCPTCWG